VSSGRADSTVARVTLHDVAREAGVHPSTVSRALDPNRQAKVKESTRRHIVSVAERLSYRPHMIARWLQSGRTATVGVIAADLGNTFVTPIIHGVAGAIEGDGMLAIIAETQDDHDRLGNIVDHMLSRRVDAIVVVAARSGDREILEVAGGQVPLIVTGRPLDGTELPHVVHDDCAGGRMVASHLQQMGHRVVAQLRGPADVANFPRRATGFSDGCREAGMVELPPEGAADVPTVAEGQRLMKLLLDKGGELPTAIFAHNDLIALGALAVLRAARIGVPDTVSIVGYNDLPLAAHVMPPLTTVRYPSLEVGRAAGEMVLAVLAGEHPQDVSIPPVLALRQSVRPVPAAG
jgi:LacI family transcriptional regulator